MKMVTVRLPGALVEDLDAESRARGVSRSDVVRDRLRQPAAGSGGRRAALESIEDLVGSVDGLPEDLSRDKKRHLAAQGYGRGRAR